MKTIALFVLVLISSGASQALDCRGTRQVYKCVVEKTSLELDLSAGEFHFQTHEEFNGRCWAFPDLEHSRELSGRLIKLFGDTYALEDQLGDTAGYINGSGVGPIRLDMPNQRFELTCVK